MGDLLKNNPILSHFLIPLLLIFMFFMLIGKPYIDAQDKVIINRVDIRIEQSLDTLISIGGKTLEEIRKNNNLQNESRP